MLIYIVATQSDIRRLPISYISFDHLNNINIQQSAMSFVNQSGIPLNAVYKQVVMEHRDDDAVEQLEARIFQMEQDHSVWRKRCFQLESQLDKCRWASENAGQLEERVTLLRQDNQQISGLLKEKATECEKLRLKVTQLENENFELASYKLQVGKLNELLEQKTNDLEAARKKLSDLCGKYLLLEQNELLVKDAQAKLDAAHKEIDVWKKLYDDQQKERIRLLDTIRSFETPAAKPVIEISSSEILQPQQKSARPGVDRLADAQSEIIHYKSDIAQLQDTLSFKDKFASKLKGDLEAKTKSLNESRMRITQLECELKNTNLLKIANQKLKDQLDQKLKELESFKRQYYSTLGKLQEAEIKLEDLFGAQNKIELLQQEKEKLNKQLKQRAEEAKVLNENVTSLKEEISRLRQNEQQKSKLDAQLVRAGSEIERLEGLAEQKDKIIEELHGTVSELQKRAAQLESELKAFQLKDYSGLQDQSKQVEVLRKQNLDLQTEHSQYEAQVFGLEQKINTLSAELQRLSQALQQKRTELQEANKRISELEDPKRYRDLEIAKQQLEAEVKQLEIELEGAQKLNESQGKEIADLKLVVAQAEARSESHLNEKNKIDQIVTSQLKNVSALESELDELRRQALEQDKQSANYKNLQAENTELRKQFEKFNDELKKLSKENEKLMIDNAAISGELSQLKKLPQEIENLRNGLDSLDEDYRKLTDVNRQLNDDLNAALKMKSDLENKIAMLSTEIERFQYKLNSRTNESQQKSQQIVTLEEQVAQLKSLETQNQQLVERVEQLEGQILELKNQNWEGQIRELMAENEQLRQQINQVQKEVAQKASERDQTEQLYQQLSKKYQELQGQNAALTKQVASISELESILSGQDKDIERLNQANNSLKQSNAQLISDLEACKTDLALLNSTISQLQNQLEQQQTQIGNTQNYEQLIAELKAQIEKLTDEKYKLENKVALLSSEIERLRVKYETQTNTLKNQKDETSGLKRELEDLTKAYESGQKEIETMGQQLTELSKAKEQEKNLGSALVGAFSEIDALRKQLQTVQQELDLQRKTNIKIASA